MTDTALLPTTRPHPWPVPAADPYRGSSGAAIAAMDWIPANVRAALIEQATMPGDQARVRVMRDAMLTERGVMLSDLRNMNFGAGKIMRARVDRSMWPADRVEMATLYAVAGYGVLNFDRCNNWAQVSIVGASVQVVPEPGSLALVAVAAAGLWIVRRRRELKGQ